MRHPRRKSQWRSARMLEGSTCAAHRQQYGPSRGPLGKTAGRPRPRANRLAGVSAPARILFCGDLVGPAGRRALLRTLPTLRERYDPTFVVVNGENVAGGFGITPKLAHAR